MDLMRQHPAGPHWALMLRNPQYECRAATLCRRSRRVAGWRQAVKGCLDERRRDGLSEGNHTSPGSCVVCNFDAIALFRAWFYLADILNVVCLKRQMSASTRFAMGQAFHGERSLGRRKRSRGLQLLALKG